ncbi:MAG: hypothetical protein Q9167_007795 [Letrouitia subvulpina]
MQQKEISGLMTYMWQWEPAKAKWAIAAKAYSTIRDHLGKGNVSLETFLDLVAPFLGIIAPADYLYELGWEISLDEGENSGFRRVREVNLGHELITCNDSVDDVISYCYDIGFINSTITSASGPSDQAVLSMATSVQPSVIPAVEVQPLTDDHSNVQGSPVSNIQASGSGAVETEMSATANDPNILGPTLPNFSYGLDSPSFADFMGTDTLPIDSTAGISAEYAYNPFGGDLFDPFNISEWINPGAFDS